MIIHVLVGAELLMMNGEVDFLGVRWLFLSLAGSFLERVLTVVTIH